MRMIKKLYAYLLLRSAVKKADKAHAKTGERYYVIPSSEKKKKKLIIIDRKNFRLLKQKRYITGNAYVRDLINESFYFTPYRNGNGYLSKSDRLKKTRLYFRWFCS